MGGKTFDQFKSRQNARNKAQNVAASKSGNKAEKNSNKE